MAERQIRIFGDPVLKTVSDPISIGDERVAGLVTDLLDTVKLPGRAGVAGRAPPSLGWCGGSQASVAALPPAGDSSRSRRSARSAFAAANSSANGLPLRGAL